MSSKHERDGRYDFDRINDPHIDISVRVINGLDEAVIADTLIWILGENGQVIDSYSMRSLSVKDPNDFHDAEVGVKLALGRSLRSLGRVILKEAQAKVNSNDKIAESQKKANLEAKKRREEYRKAAQNKRRAEVLEGLGITPDLAQGLDRVNSI